MKYSPTQNLVQRVFSTLIVHCWILRSYCPPDTATRRSGACPVLCLLDGTNPDCCSRTKKQAKPPFMRLLVHSNIVELLMSQRKGVMMIPGELIRGRWGSRGGDVRFVGSKHSDDQFVALRPSYALSLKEKVDEPSLYSAAIVLFPPLELEQMFVFLCSSSSSSHQPSSVSSN